MAPRISLEQWRALLAVVDEGSYAKAAKALHMSESLMRVRFILAAHPDHQLHKLGRKLSIKDLRAHRQLVVRESSPRRATPLTMEATQRWTVSNLATSIEAARSGHGFAWLPEERI